VGKEAGAQGPNDRTHAQIFQPAFVVRPSVERAVEQYLTFVDRHLPGLVTGYYLRRVALGAYRLARTDIDFVAVVARGLARGQLGRLRRAHLR
jgi:hypothetical protein